MDDGRGACWGGNVRHLEGGGTHDGKTRLEHQPCRVAKGLLAAVKMGEVWPGVSFREVAVCMHQPQGHFVLCYNHVI